MFLKSILKFAQDEAGVSLISTSLMIIVLSQFAVLGSRYYDIWRQASAVNITDERIDEVQKALRRYVSENGRYPCPAPLSTNIDNVGFAVEVTGDCTVGDFPGTFRSIGRDNRRVRTGAVPVRTLNIDDKYMLDGFHTRLIYAVTEEYAAPAPVSALEEDNGAITIIDGNGNNATSSPGNIVQVVYSMGGDANGAYSVDGALIENCDAALRSSENCDFNNNAVFLNTVHKSHNENNLFVQQMSYIPSKTVLTCEDDISMKVPKNIAFLMDTSGSMMARGACPSSMGARCSRIDVTRWAMRRVMPARIFNNSQIQDAGTTFMTGFVGYDNLRNVNRNLGDIIFDDPSQSNYVAPDEDTLAERLENELQSMCPSGLTPLGLHLRALADRVGDGTEDRPNKIMVLSDGANTNGMSPITAARQINAIYPNLHVDIIDVVGNPSLINVARITGGNYYLTTNPDELLDALYHSSGSCPSDSPPDPPEDRPGCGSSGGWWQ